MTELDDIDAVDFDAIFKRSGKVFASREERDRRLSAERRAGFTPKQRQRMAVPKKIVNFRATEETRALIKRLEKHFGEGQTSIMLRAIEHLAASLPSAGASEQA